MTSTHEGHLDLPGLPPNATLSHIVPEMTTHNLLSVGQLCDAGCTATVTRDNIEISHDDQVIITGTRSSDTTLWHMDVPSEVDQQSTFPHHANAAIGNDTAANMVAFMHAAFFSPAISTLEKALQKGFINNIPGFTQATLKKYPPKSVAMVKGHLDQTRQNVRSTKTTTETPVEDDDFYPLQLTVPNNEETNYCYATIFSQSGKMYSDQTGNFFQASSKGNLLIMILYDYDSNAILAEPIKNRQAESILAAYEKMHKLLVSKGMKPKTQILDNECSQKLKDYMVKNNIKYQLATPGQHRANAAERAIRTFKNHFVAGLCSTDDHFPLHLWDRLIEQAVITLNLLRGSRINPKQSAWSQFHGPYDHNAWPLAPPGIHVLVHEKPDNRKSWAPHANDGWYIGPAINHYRSYRVYMRDTQGERITDTLSWFPQHIPLPTATSTEIIVASLQDVVQELQAPTAPNAILQLDNNKRAELIDITNRLTNIIENTEPHVHSNIAETSSETTEATAPRVEEENGGATSPRVTASTISNDENNNGVGASDNEDSENKATMRMKKVTFNSQLPTFHTYEYVTNITNKKTRRNVKEAPIEKYPKVTQYEKYSHKRVTRASSNHAYVVQQAPHFAYFGNAINPDTNQPAEYLELSKCSEGAEWIKSASEEFGRLAQGNGTTVLEGTNTIRFIHLKDIPEDKKPTYLKMVVADRPEKTNPKRVRNTIGGDRIQYDGDTSTKAAEITTCKIFVNSIISTPGARCVTGDLKDFYLQTAKMPEKDLCIHDDPNQCRTTRHHRKIQLTGLRGQWQGICRGIQRNIWTPTSRKISQRTINPTSGTIWICTMSTHCRTMDT